MVISIIAAVSRNGVIGRNGTIPWSIREDLAFFKRMTTGKTVIMGRKTYESIGKPLPDRFNIVISSSKIYSADNCITVSTFKEALEKAEHNDVFVCGGYQVYKTALPYTDKLYITEIDEEFEGDTFFPYFEKKNYKKNIISEFYEKYNCRFVKYEKII